jgi:HAD superfamily hydrolase (TIGR01450 family)
VWNGSALEPGAREALLALHASGRSVGFLSNNSRAFGADLRRRLHGHGIAIAEHVVTPLEIIGEFIAERFGRARALVMGAAELAEAVRRGGHELVPFDRAREATVVVVGNDFDVSYARLAAAARAAAAGAPLVTPNLDARLPVEGGDFLPGCAAFVEAVAVAAGVRPVVVGKPDPALFHVTMRRMGVAPALAAMVGDSPEADMRGGRAAGMHTILYAPKGQGDPGVSDLVIRSFDELLALVGLAPADRRGVP